MKKIIILASGILFSCVTTCCSFLALFKSDTAGGTMTNADGKVILKDNQVQWEFFTAGMDAEIQGELSGNRPPGGYPTWNDRWLGSVKSLRSNQENHEKYIDYIIQKRREKGLRELDGL